MPVIGRLDDEVWKVLIEPIAKRHEREKQDGHEEELREEREKSGEAKVTKKLPENQ